MQHTSGASVKRFLECEKPNGGARVAALMPAHVHMIADTGRGMRHVKDATREQVGGGCGFVHRRMGGVHEARCIHGDNGGEG